MPNNKRMAQRKSRRPRLVAAGPGQFSANVSFSHTYRFVSTSGTSTVITPTSVLCAAGTVCTVVNSTCTSFFGSFKINRVSIWTPPASQGSSATCSVTWNGNANSPNKEISDTTVSVSRPAHVSTTPPPQSVAAFWQTPGTGNLFTIVAPTGSIIDISLQLILSDNDTPTSASSTVATASLAGVFYLSLDPNATHRYTPVSLTTTF